MALKLKRKSIPYVGDGVIVSIRKMVGPKEGVPNRVIKTSDIKIGWGTEGVFMKVKTAIKNRIGDVVLETTYRQLNSIHFKGSNYLITQQGESFHQGHSMPLLSDVRKDIKEVFVPLVKRDPYGDIIKVKDVKVITDKDVRLLNLSTDILTGLSDKVLGFYSQKDALTWSKEFTHSGLVHSEPEVMIGRVSVVEENSSVISYLDEDFCLVDAKFAKQINYPDIVGYYNLKELYESKF